MPMPNIDWRITSILVMLFLGVYAVAIRKFFISGGDWRMLLPVAGLVGLLSLAYFALVYRDVSFSGGTILPITIAMVSIGIVTLLSMLVYSDPKAQMNVAMPLMALSMVSTAVLSIFFLGETVTLKTWAGIALALVAIFLLAV